MLFGELKLDVEMDKKQFMKEVIPLLHMAPEDVDDEMMGHLDFLREMLFAPKDAAMIINDGHLEAVVDDAYEALVLDPNGYQDRMQAKYLKEGHYISY